MRQKLRDWRKPKSTGRKQTVKAVAKAHAQTEAIHAETLIEAEKNWKAAESTRLAGAEAQWQEQTAKAIADTRIQTEAVHGAKLAEAEKNWKAEETNRRVETEAQWAEQTAKAVADARAERDKIHGEEAARLRGDIASLQAAFVAREAELREIRSQLQQERENSEQQIAARIADAKTNWKTKEDFAISRWPESNGRQKFEGRSPTPAPKVAQKRQPRWFRRETIASFATCAKNVSS